MYLKKLTENKLITINYYTNGTLQTIQGHVYKLNLTEQVLSLKDESQNLFSIRLSQIRNIS